METAITSILIFVILVFIHEFGHFAVAKLCGVRVLEFAIGMGPAIFKRKKGETIYSLRAIPIGGYCSLLGENENTDDNRAFCNQHPIKKILVLVAGAFMNILLGFVLICILMFAQGTDKVAIPTIDTVAVSSPAEMAGLKSGDKILEINGATIKTQMELRFEISRAKDKEIEVTYQRNDIENTVKLTPFEKDGAYYIGFRAKVEELTFGGRIYQAYRMTLFYGKLILVSLWDLVTGAVSPKLMSGPVGIVNEINTATSYGILAILNLGALITINLGLFNLLPLPALDGGRMLFAIVELIIRRKIPADKEGIIHAIGFLLLILLSLYATWNDILRIFK